MWKKTRHKQKLEAESLVQRLLGTEKTRSVRSGTERSTLLKGKSKWQN